MPIGSILKQAAKSLPDNIKAEAIPNILKKRGVKAEELKYAGIKPATSKADLVKQVDERPDTFTTVELAQPAYQSHSLEAAKTNPSYREKVLTYSDKNAKPNGESRYTSQHFGEVPDYLMHSRVYDDDLDGKSTRVIQEVQSDLHQAGRQQGYIKAGETNAFDSLLMDSRDTTVPIDTLVTRAQQLGLDLSSDMTEEAKRFEIEAFAASEASDVIASAIPESPFEKTWLRKGLEREISDAIDEGKEQIAIPISGAVDSLERGEGVQKWYETVVASTAKKLAKSSGMDFEVKTVDEVVYATLKGKPNKAFSLYSSPAAATMTAYVAFKSGMPQDDVEAQLTEEGYSPEEIQGILGDVNKVAQMKAEGYTDEQIKPLLDKQEVGVGGTDTVATSPLEPKDPGRISDAQAKLAGDEELSIKDQLTHMQVMYPDLSYVHTNVAGLFGDREAQRVSDEAVMASRQRIVNEFAKRGVSVTYGTDRATGNQEWLLDTGEVITPAWYESFSSAQSEIILGIEGAVGGGMAGAKLASAVTPPPLTPPSAVLKLAAMGVGAVVGAAIGAAAGTEADYLHSAMELQADMEATVAARKAFNAAEMSVIGDAVGFGLFKVGKGAWRSLTGAKSLIKKGMNGRAATALEESMFITKEESEELVAKLARVSDIEGKPTEQAVEAVALTRPGSETLVQAAVADSPRAAQAVIKSIDERAKDLLASTKELSGDNLGRFIREDLEGYRTLVKDEFSRVKKAAAQAPRLNSFRFNYDKMAIDPVLENLGKELIEGSPEQMKFLHSAQQIRDLSASRRLPDLLELRKLVNNFQYNKRLKNARSYEMLAGIKTGIDKAIRQGAEVTMDNPKQWLSSWTESNKSYHEMKMLETNKLAKAIAERPAKDLAGKNEADLAKAMVKFSTSLDSTFVDVMSKLPKKSRMRVEGLVIDELANKYTTGAVGGVKATDFPALAYELEKVTLTSPESRSMRKAILELADVFKNDLPVATSAGGVHTPRLANVMSDNVVSKAKFALASESFHRAKAWMPTAKGRASALVSKTAEVIDNPLKSKTIKELQKMLDGQFNLNEELEQLLKVAAQEKAAGTGTARLKLYGDGKVLVGKGNGKEHSVNPANIASTETMRDISEATGINLADKRAMDRALTERGYVAAQLGADKVRLLGK